MPVFVSSDNLQLPFGLDISVHVSVSFDIRHVSENGFFDITGLPHTIALLLSNIQRLPSFSNRNK